MKMEGTGGSSRGQRSEVNALQSSSSKEKRYSYTIRRCAGAMCVAEIGVVLVSHRAEASTEETPS
ncbi:hypothetical protein EYF80_063481 [Liparis tanakae]|uniref:Uncharacterized protein n=1 Tax=Liparis tanakae TaxID=230148 RepID=A0A4Z2EDM2_9TELE|nr:hypothetical protein EYF80_063481 [Liparis tanakae]